MKKQRNFFQYLGISLRGLAMGAADVIPGVSGGTIAFITGIYEELITSISNVNLTALKKLRKEGVSSFWKHINGNFFVALFFGIAISILSLASTVTYLLDKFPVLLWAFFFGLIIASIVIMAKTIEKWKMNVIIGLIVGTAVAAYVSLLQTTASGEEFWYIFLSGSLAICAMILPGISGAFILVLLGTYGIVLNGLKEMNLPLIFTFLAGCLIGILSFSHLLKYLFKHYKDFVLATLTGFLIGSLLKIWPWKNNFGNEPIIIHSDGREEFMQTNVLPSQFIGDSQILWVILLAVLGFLLVFLLDKMGEKLRGDN